MSARALILTIYTEYMKTYNTTCPESWGDLVHLIFSYTASQFFFMDKNLQVLNLDQQIPSTVKNLS